MRKRILFTLILLSCIIVTSCKQEKSNEQTSQTTTNSSEATSSEATAPEETTEVETTTIATTSTPTTETVETEETTIPITIPTTVVPPKNSITEEQAKTLLDSFIYLYEDYFNGVIKFDQSVSKTFKDTDGNDVECWKVTTTGLTTLKEFNNYCEKYFTESTLENFKGRVGSAIYADEKGQLYTTGSMKGGTYAKEYQLYFIEADEKTVSAKTVGGSNDQNEVFDWTFVKVGSVWKLS
ncbi:MAG: hypothetical protein LBN42_04340 [Oscillospiraceae bacterium]|jgi:hypothetical protein|nr:hypothetical protein [Oscillospiraceae bacterium]